MTYSHLSELWTFPALMTLALIFTMGLILIQVTSGRVTSFDVRPVAYAAMILSCLIFFGRVVMVGYLVADEALWHRLGAEAADLLLIGSTGSAALATVPAGKEGYVWILGWLYSISGAAPAVPVSLNIVMHGLLVVVLAKTTEAIAVHTGRELSIRVTAVRSVAVTAAFVPSIALWVPLALRETLTLFCIAVSLMLAMFFITTRNTKYLIYLLPPLGVLIWVRGSIGLALVAGLLIGMSFLFLSGARFAWVGRFLLVVPLSVVLIYLGTLVDSQTSLDAAAVTNRSVDLATSAGSGFAGISGTSSLMEVLLIQGPRVVAGPFLWEFRPNGVMILAFSESLAWIMGVYLASRSGYMQSKQKVDREIAALFVCVALILVAALAISVGNYGILARLRPMIFVVLLPLAGFGYARLIGAGRKDLATPG